MECFREEIVEVHEQTITTGDGSTREMDVLILATGFDIPCNIPSEQWMGCDEEDIAAGWSDQEGAFTFYGVMTLKAANFFMIWGPQSGSCKLNVFVRMLCLDLLTHEHCSTA